MSILYGDEVIAYLAKKSQQNDIKSSSHWNNYHSEFRFQDVEFSGLIGFGINSKQHFGIKKMLHYFLQYPYRLLARNFSDFVSIYKTAQYISRKINKGFDYDMMRQVITLAYLNEMKVANFSDGVIVKFRDYPWHLASEILDDGLCPGTQKYYSFKPPFYYNFQGKFQHRLVNFS